MDSAIDTTIEEDLHTRVPPSSSSKAHFSTHFSKKLPARHGDLLTFPSCQVFFMQLGDSLFTSALHKVANMVFTNLLTHQLDHLGILLSCLCKVNPQATVKKILPTCLQILLLSPSVYSPHRHKSPNLHLNPPNSSGHGSLWAKEHHAWTDMRSPLNTSERARAATEYKLAPLSDMEVGLLLVTTKARYSLSSLCVEASA